MKNTSVILVASTTAVLTISCGHRQAREPATNSLSVANDLATETDESELPYSEADLERIPPSTQYERLESLGDVSFDWPVDEARLTRGFIPERRRKKRPHWGIDLAGPRGTHIFSAQAGTVIYAGKAFRGYGKMVLVENRNGWATLYAHLSKIDVREGSVVARGDKIAEMGNTGRSTGNHLHFEIRRDRKPVDPMGHLPGVSGVNARNPDLPILGDLATFFSVGGELWQNKVALVGNFSNSWDAEASPSGF